MQNKQADAKTKKREDRTRVVGSKHTHDGMVDDAASYEP